MGLLGGDFNFVFQKFLLLGQVQYKLIELR